MPGPVKLRHAFQTNGLLLNQDWVRFQAQAQASVGVSLDGPADLHDANRRTHSGHGTHQQVMRGIRLLQEQDVDFHVITVLTQRSLDDPDRLFDFYVQNAIHEVGFNIEEIEGTRSTSSLARDGVEAKFRTFIKRFFAGELGFRMPPRGYQRLFDIVVPAVLAVAGLTLVYRLLSDFVSEGIYHHDPSHPYSLPTSVRQSLSYALAAGLMYGGAVYIALWRRRKGIEQKVWRENSPICLLPIALFSGVVTWVVIMASTVIGEGCEATGQEEDSVSGAHIFISGGTTT